MDVVVTYEGGGARGIWHIGALRMLEASQLPDDPRYARLPKYRVLGVNGTSMGALVAALHAVGYKADQMLDLREPVSEQPKPTIWTRILYTLKLRQRIAEGSIVLQNAGILKLIQLFNWRQRIAIWFLSASKSRSNLKKFVFWCSIIAGVFLPVLMFFGLMRLYRLKDAEELHAALGTAALTSLLMALFARQLVVGLGSGEQLADRLDLCLAAVVHDYDPKIIKMHHKKIRKKIYTRVVTFSELSRYIARTKNGDDPTSGFARPIGLAMIASNITTGRLEKFSNNNTPAAIIAEAVAASCAMPILFKPFLIRKPVTTDAGTVGVENFYVDGAITSNLPVWTSDMARAANPDLISMSFGAVSNIPYALRNVPERIGAFVNTAMFGSGPLETRRTRNAPFVYEPNPDSPVGLLDFNMEYGRASAEIAAAGRALHRQITLRALRRDVHGNAARNLAVAVASQCVGGHAIRGGSADKARPNIRVSLLRPVRFGQDGLAKYQTYSSNPAAEFVDNEMTFDGSHSLPGAAWKDQDDSRPLQVAELMVGGVFDSRGLMWRAAERVGGGAKERVDPRLDHGCWQAKWAMSRRLNLDPLDEEIGSQFHLRNPRWLVVLVESDIELSEIARGIDAQLVDINGVKIVELSKSRKLLKLFSDYEIELNTWNQQQSKQLLEFRDRKLAE